MHKKLLSGLLAASMALTAAIGFTACGNDPDASHTHTTVHHAAQQPTCTENGNTEYWSCNGCDKLFADKAGTVEISLSTVTLTAAHSYGADNACTVCGDVWHYTEGLKYELDDETDTYTVTGIGTANTTDITIPYYHEGKKVMQIGRGAFSQCSSLTSVTVPNSVTSIGDSAFECSGLTEITIPNRVTSIGRGAFYRCYGLTEITIPNSVTSIGEFAFTECSGLTHIFVEGGNTKYHSAGNCLIETATKTLIAGCANSVIPTDGSVTSIGDYAFYNCGFTEFTIPNGIISIGEDAFVDWSGRLIVTIPNSVTSIGNFAFSRSIIFQGTIAEWKLIKKDCIWDVVVSPNILIFATIQCTDGKLDAYGNEIE